MTKANCTNRAQWQFQIGKPAERLSPHYQLDCDFGSPLMAVWGSAESEPIYLCEEHGKEFESSARFRADANRQARQLAERKERESTDAPEEIGIVKSVFSDAFEAEDDISDVYGERTQAAPFSAEQRAAIPRGMTEQNNRLLGEKHPHLFAGVATALLLATLATASAFLFNTHRREVGEVLIQWGERLQASSTASASQIPAESPEESSAALASAPVDTAPTGPARVAPAAVQVAASPSNSTHPPAKASKVSDAQKQTASRSAGAGSDASLSASESNSEGTGDASSSAATAPLLWTKLAQGNLAAEIKLARLYLRGNGVGKSCEQARVLLQAASAKGYTQAKHMLVALDEDADTDC